MLLSMSEVELDPRWDWVEVQEVSGATYYVRGSCRHLEVVPVESVAGEVVAQLCTTCDMQFLAPTC